MPRLSIIVPIYNSECYLKRCIDSILSQSFVDFELLLINDGSTDTSLDICNSYVSNDERIKVIDKKNSGVSATRNAGLNIATGTWITFVDSDDWLDQGFFDIMNYSICSDLVVGTVIFKSNNSRSPIKIIYISNMSANNFQIAHTVPNLSKPFRSSCFSWLPPWCLPSGCDRSAI